MQEQVIKTRKFLIKQRLTLNKDLKDSKSFDRFSKYLRDSAGCMLRTAKKMEDAMDGEQDPRFERTHMLIEELGETLLGLANCDEVETLDGLSDLVFVAIGTAIAFGLPVAEGLDEVCDSNLTKSPRKDSDPRLRDKGIDYVPPNIARVLSWHRGLDVRAQRTSCHATCPTYQITVHVERRYHEELKSWWVEITKGGVTGYESIEASHVKEKTDGWSACNGTKNKWDELFLPAESMKEIQTWLEQ